MDIPIFLCTAIDLTQDITEALESITAMGFERILTSGGEATSVAGILVIKQLVSQVSLTMITSVAKPILCPALRKPAFATWT